MSETTTRPGHTGDEASVAVGADLPAAAQATAPAGSVGTPVSASESDLPSVSEPTARSGNVGTRVSASGSDLPSESEATARSGNVGTRVSVSGSDLPSGDIDAAQLNASLPWHVRVMRYLAQPRWWLEIILLGSLYAVYSAIRNMVGEVTGEAFANGRGIYDFERRWNIALEEPLNSWVHHTPWVADPSAVEYASLHFIVTPAVLIWLMLRRKSVYRRVSSILIVCTALALIGFYTMPTAPPRLLDTHFPHMTGRFYDIMAETGSWGWWPESGAPGSTAVSNQYAAMPSLHCAWATWCGIMLFLYARRRWVRTLGVLYPFTTFFVVMATGNHYLIDVLAGVATLAVAALIVYIPIWAVRWSRTGRGRRESAEVVAADG